MIFMSALVLLVSLSSCRKTPSESIENNTRPEQNKMNARVPASELKTPSDPIGMSACRIAVEWEESIPEEDKSLVNVIRFIGTGPSYSGYRPQEGDALIILGLTGALFEDVEELIIEVQPPLTTREGEIPEMSLLKIIK